MTASETGGARLVREQLARMAASPVFRGAGRMHPLLEYLVAMELAGDGAQLNQYRIAIDVLGRDESFDPSSDSIVRVEVGRLRNKLREYDAAGGNRDRIRFELPKGTYGPRIIDTGAAEAAPDTATGQAEHRLVRRVGVLRVAARADAPVPDRRRRERRGRGDHAPDPRQHA